MWPLAAPPKSSGGSDGIAVAISGCDERFSPRVPHTLQLYRYLVPVPFIVPRYRNVTTVYRTQHMCFLMYYDNRSSTSTVVYTDRFEKMQELEVVNGVNGGTGIV
eukprot:COSAG02_NODE_1031_length_15073_cov_13.084279_3_plen_105_part_00